MRSHLIKAGLVVGLFAQGALLGLAWQYLTQPKLATAPPPEKQPKISVQLPMTKQLLDPQHNRQVAEELLSDGDPFAALPYFLNAAPYKLEQADSPLLLQLALCYEASREWKRARDLYRRLLDREESASLVNVSRLGLARCLIHERKFSEASFLLWPLVLLTDRYASNPLYQDATYLLGQAMFQPSFDDHVGWDDEHRLSLPPPIESSSVHLENYKISEQQELDEANASRDRPGLLEITEAYGEGEPEEIVLSIVADSVDLFHTFQLIGVKLGVSINVTDLAEKTIQYKKIRLDYVGSDLATLLDAMTLPIDMMWISHEGEIYLQKQDEADPELLRRFFTEAARRMTNRALFLSPDHRDVGLARMIVGNATYELGEPEEAIVRLEEVLLQHPSGPVRQTAYYNLGTIYHRFGESQKSIDRMTQVVESNASISMHAAAYYQMGLVQLRRGDLDPSIQAFSRAIRISIDEKLTRYATLGLGIAYLLNDYPRVAHRVVFERRSKFKGFEEASAARALTQAADWFANGETMNDLYKSELLSGLSDSTWPAPFRTPGRMLVAETYYQLGFVYTSTEILEDLIDLSESDWIQEQVMDALVERWFATGRFNEVRELGRLGLIPPLEARHIPLLYYLAEIDFQEGALTRSRQRFYQLIELNPPEELKTKTLLRLGKIYERLGQHQQANLCFLGILPDQDDATESINR